MTTETAWRFLLGLIVAAGWCGCGQSDPSRSDALPAPQRIEEQILSEESTPGLPQPKFIAGACRVYTSEPGWSVFIDGYPVRNPDGSILQTPCRVTAVIGAHSVGVAREGQLDQSRIVTFAEDAELVFETATAPTGESVLLSAPFLTTAIGEPIELTSLNTTGREFDPFLSPDGRGLLFAAERAEGKGIYTASRLSPLHPFDSPTLLRLTSSIDQPASPSVNGAATMVVYTLPSKGRIRALTRTSPLADFEQPKVLLADEDLTARYPSAQVLSSAERIYFTRETEGILETRVTTPTPERSQPFGNVMIVQFPGVHPRLSTDGLRQYLFDGQTLLRARRTATNLPFGPTEEVAQIELSGYQASAGHRQFCVSDDEQWLFYSDDPVSAGDLWMVRLSAGPGWGLPLSGTTIEPRVIAKTDPEMRPEEHAATDAPDVEPET
ncbi:MAG: PD40 domain-containing protein, partial [Planctomycetaceae bacterium]|nr:PD40 domain-containing protein [Planctomycetaceae bacterium]